MGTSYRPAIMEVDGGCISCRKRFSKPLSAKCACTAGPPTLGPPRLSQGRRLGDVFGVGTRARVTATEKYRPKPIRHREATYPRMTALTSTTELTFAQLGVRDEIVRALAENGIEHAFAIQELTLPLALAGDDLIGQARTGMGKTFAFGVPLLHRITTDTERPLTGIPRALVVVPTRELCIQVYEDLVGASKYLRADESRKLTVTAIYGGRPYEPQIEALQKGVDVVVGTPGRLLDLAQQGHLQLGGLSTLVLDEADEMLDLGFLPDIERILKQIPAQRQAMLFSATMPDPIITLARTFMMQPTHIRAEA